jgi:hypothetical protein
VLKRFWLRRHKKVQYEPWLDRTRPFELLTRQPLKARALEYHYLDTDERVKVPNVWFNQTLASQAAAAECKAYAARKKLKELRQQTKLDPAARAMLKSVIHRAVTEAHAEDLKAKALREESLKIEAKKRVQKS